LIRRPAAAFRWPGAMARPGVGVWQAGG